jgi:elongation factor P
MALSINDIKGGLTILIDGAVWIILEAHHIKPGKGAAFTRAKMRNLKNNSVQERTFRGDEKIEEAYVEERKLQYQYKSGDIYHFMDQENFEEVAIPEDAMGDKAKFLMDNLDVMAYFYKEDILYVNLPNFIIVKITSTEPGIKGDTAKSGTKPAQIETGATVQVPLFVVVDDTIKVDTRTGQYVERAAA